MGRLIKQPPHASETREWILRQYEHLHENRGPEFEWFLGDEDRFEFSHRWMTEDQIWWEEGYVSDCKPIDRIEMRKWIERHLDGDVMISEGRDSSKYYPEGKAHSWKYTFYNKYWVDFHFETEADLSHFLIRWA